MKKKKNNYQRQISDIDQQLFDCRSRFVDGDPTIKYNIGDMVQFGGFDSAIIEDIFDDGKFYLLNTTLKKNVRFDQPPVEIKSQVVAVWFNIFKPFCETNVQTPFCYTDDLTMDVRQCDISSLLHIYYFFGIDMNPEYQRNLVWSPEQEHDLLDSIYNNIDIGKFALNHLDYSATNKFSYEIIDGKQRLNTLIKFNEGRIKYKDKTIFEMHSKDRYHFTDHTIAISTVKNATQNMIYKYFVKMNTGGVTVSREHLDKVRQLIQ